MIKKLTYNGFGFPIVLANVPVKMIRGRLEPVINYKELSAAVITALCLKQTPLTGNQVKFIRLFFEMSLRDFAALFGLTHQAVMKWEEHGDKFASISPAIEKTLRLDALFRLGATPREFYKIFSDLQTLASTLQKSESLKEAPLKLAM